MTNERDVDVGYGALLVAMAAVLVYLLAIGNGFAFDDVVLIPGDPRVVSSHIGALLTKPYWNDTALALYRPLTSLTFALDWHAANGSPAWFHFTNILWHALASVLAYLLLARFFRTPAAIAGGLLFALHPVHVEAVANVVGRSESIAAVFFLGACLVWSTRELSRWTRTLVTTLCYVLAMLAKESAVVLPAILFLIDAAQNEKPRWREYVVVSIAFVVFMFIRWRVVGGIAPSRLDPSMEAAHGWWQRLLTALQAWPIDARLLFFPRTLLADYGPRILMPISEFTSLAAIGLTIITALVVGGVVALARRKGLWALGLLWFPIMILPVSNLIVPIGVLVAERTLYLPSLAVCIAAAAIIEMAPRRYAFEVVVAIGVVLGARTVLRIPDWKSTDTIMTALVRDRPDAFRGQWHMARMARAQGDALTALTRYDQALRLWPNREGLVQEAAAYGGEKGRSAWARNVALWGTRRWPNNIHFQRMLAANAVDMGDTVTARRALQAALRIAPQDTILNQMWQAFGAPHPR